MIIESFVVRLIQSCSFLIDARIKNVIELPCCCGKMFSLVVVYFVVLQRQIITFNVYLLPFIEAIILLAKFDLAAMVNFCNFTTKEEIRKHLSFLKYFIADFG